MRHRPKWWLHLLFVPASIPLLFGSSARAEPMWVKGPVDNTRHWCVDDPLTPERQTPPTPMQLIYGGEEDGSLPSVGDVYYLLIEIFVPACAERLAAQTQLRIHLPPDTQFAITDDRPIECGSRPAGGGPVTMLPAVECATTKPVASTSVQVVNFANRGTPWDIEPAGRLYRPLVANATNLILIPVVTTKPQRPESAAFVVQQAARMDLNKNDRGLPRVNLTVEPGSGANPGGNPGPVNGGSSAPSPGGSIGGEGTSAGGCAVGSGRPRHRGGTGFLLPALLALLPLVRRRTSR